MESPATDLRLATLGKAAAPSATEQVFDALHSALVTLDLPPGTKVSEAEIARQLDVSRQPVRDAFFRLSKLGFLEIRPQRATLITKISTAAVRQAAFIRIALEIACIRAATARATAADIARLDDNLARQREAVDENDRSRFHSLDDGFHSLICATAGHGYVWPLIEDYKAHMDRVRYLTLMTDTELVFGQHRDILAAIASGDAEAGETRMRSHLSRIEQILNDVRRDHAQYFEDVS